MKAIRVHQTGDPSVLKLQEVPDPTPDPSSAAGQIVVSLKAVGVNPVETYIRAGRYGQKDFPYTPGSDAAGIVDSIGAGIRRFRAGQRVYLYGSLTGTYAQKALCLEKHLHPLPDHVSFEQGAALGVPYATAYRALLHRAQARPGETVLIHGASGGVGIAAVQIGRAAGLTVIGTAGTDKGRQLILAEGAHHALDHTKPDYLAQLSTLTAGQGQGGVNVILEMLANVNLSNDLTVLSKFGRVVVIGSRGRIEIDPRDTMARDADIRGMTLFNVPDADLASIHAALLAGLENKTLRPIINTTLPLADAPKAHELVMSPGAHGKIILLP